MAILKKPYEISVWEDVAVQENGYQYYTERRLATIGSNTMTSLMRAINPSLTLNINGTETLKFSMYYQYVDNETGELTHNPLVDLLVNERKVKLYYEGEDPNHPDNWYDFIIKKDEERARDNKFNFTCTSLAANELGKTGFKVELDTELKNNMGTVQQLGEKVLKDSDWQLSEDSQDIIQQTINEPLYKIYLNTNIQAKVRGTSNTKQIPANKYIYVYYTSYTQKVNEYFQFIYIEDNATITTLTDGVTLVCDNQDSIWDLYLDNVNWVNNKPSFQSGEASVANYRGDRYVRKQKTLYNPVLDQTVKIYEDSEHNEVHGYQTTRYLDATCVTNYIHNSTNFGGASYWSAFGKGTKPSSIERVVYPPVNGENTADERKNYLSVIIGNTWQEDGTNHLARIMNNGIVYNYSRIKTFDKNDIYILRAKVKGKKDETLSDYLTTGSNFPFTCQVRKYIKIDDYTDDDTRYFNFLGSEAQTDPDDEDYAIIYAQCINAASWEDLKENLGIFFFRSSNYNNEYDSYYIEDIQLYQAIPNGNGGYLKIGEVPEVKYITIDHYYYPNENLDKTKADEYIFVSEDNDTQFTPIYGDSESEFEKVRSITAKESNRFNLIQQLCETFECWVKFNISHESSGQISIINKDIYEPIKLTEETYEINTYYIYDYLNEEYIISSDEFDANKQYFEIKQRKVQNKTVTFYKEIIENNPIGFKYGINLKDVTRTLDSDQIATKIIVKNNSCDQAKNGFCSITRAKDNPTKENFLYNFDYYISQGILDKNIVYNDLYLELNGSIGLYPKLARYNSERNELIDESAELANAITNLTSEVQVAQLTYNAAAEELSKLNDPVSGKLVKYTGYVYNDYINQVERAGGSGANYKISAYINEIYYIKDGTGLTSINTYSNSNSSVNEYYKEIQFHKVEGTTEINQLQSDLSTWSALKYYWLDGAFYRRCKKDDTYDSNKEYYNLGEAEKRPFYIKAGDNKFTWLNDTYSELSGSKTYYWRYDNASISGLSEIYFQLKDNNINNISFTYTGAPKVYVYGAYIRIAQAADDDTVNDTTTINNISQIDTLTKNKKIANENYNKFNQELIEELEKYNQIKDRLGDIAKATEEIEKEFNFKYARYIQEGSWNDDNYMDDDLYYLDAVNVLYQSAYPKTSYTISVLELSALEGYEAYKFQIAHKTFMEDTEFFGWSDYALRIPARESIIVTEISIALDEPDKNTIKVQNYKSHFEDLFQRIAAATQNLEYHSGDYARASDAVQSNGTIAQSVLQKSLATAAYIISNSNNQSVVIDDTGLQATKTNDPAEVVRLSSGGMLISTDGGETWGVAISGYGINTDYLTAGVIDADKINIMNGAYPTFKWDTNGLRALSFTQKNGTIGSYNAAQYVTYDRFGIYGINGILNFEPQNVTDVEKNSTFALTWNGLYIRSNYRDGYVSISPNDDITLYGYNIDKFQLYNKANPEFDQSYFEANKNNFYINRNGIYEECTTESYYDILNEDLYVKNDNGDSNKTPVKRAKFGMLGVTDADEELYGLALYDSNGNTTVTTQSDGTLWLQDSMRIGTENQTNTIYIGVGETDTTPGQNRYKVINVNDTNNNEKFVVYSDGTLKASGADITGTIHATSGEFTGTIYATGGTIGGLSINTLPDTVGVRITPGSGQFKVNSNVATPASLTFNYKTSLTVTSTQWQYGSTPNNMINVPTSWINYQDNSVTLNYNNIKNTFASGVMYLKVIINNEYTDIIAIEYVVDGESGTTITNVFYGVSNDGETQPVDWSTLIPQVQSGQWLWTKTIYSDGNEIFTKSYSGTNGINGQDGQDGQDAIIYTCSIDSSAGTVINTANISTGSTTTITGHVYKIVGSNAPEEVIQNITYTWYKKNQVSPIANTKSFQFNLDGNWEEVQIYFEAVINGAS